MTTEIPKGLGVEEARNVAVHLQTAATNLMSAGAQARDMGAALNSTGTGLQLASMNFVKALEAHQTFMDNWLEKFIIARNTHE